jgi:hypothetical protein
MTVTIIEGIGEDRVLEALYAAKRRIEATTLGVVDGYGPLSEDVWDFGHWNACTCGHIYGATTNNDTDIPEKAKDHNLIGRITDEAIVDGLYEETLRLIVRANELEPNDTMAETVSDATADCIGDYEEDGRSPSLRRQRAIELIDNTINYIEDRQRAAMALRAVKARTGAPVSDDRVKV